MQNVNVTNINMTHKLITESIYKDIVQRYHVTSHMLPRTFFMSNSPVTRQAKEMCLEMRAITNYMHKEPKET